MRLDQATDIQFNGSQVNSVYYNNNLIWSSAPPPAIEWTPLQITGVMNAWFDPSQTSTIISSNNSVSEISDLGPVGFKLANSNAANQPETNTHTINGLNTLSFDSGNIHFLRSYTGAEVLHPLTNRGSGEIVTGESIFMVIQNRGEPIEGGSTLYYVYNPALFSANNRLLFNIYSPGNNRLIYRVPETAQAVYTASNGWVSTSGTTHLLGLTADKNPSSPFVALYDHGTLKNSSTNYSNVYSGGGWDNIGKSTVGENPHSNIGEMIFLNTVPDSSTREKIEGYLAHKWGTTGELDASHPYKSTPPYV